MVFMHCISSDRSSSVKSKIKIEFNFDNTDFNNTESKAENRLNFSKINKH